VPTAVIYRALAEVELKGGILGLLEIQVIFASRFGGGKFSSVSN
jgi:hypothetical protein